MAIGNESADLRQAVKQGLAVVSRKPAALLGRAGTATKVYNEDDFGVAHRVRAWCLERGDDTRIRIALCGYSGEGHEELESNGWTVQHWKANGGYGSRSADNANAKKERIWFSPHCLTKKQREMWA